MPPVEPDAARGPALRAAKLGLRSRILLARDALSPADRAARSAAIAARIEALPSYDQAPAALLTLSFRSEWDTLPLIARALASGKSVIVPRVDTRARMLELCRIRDLAHDIAPGYYGIPEPLPTMPHAAPEEIAFVLVPGVAFDRDGRRLGYGGGFYDRLLPLLPPHAPRVAGAYALQIVPHVPAAPHDMKMDAVVTDEDTIVVRGAV